MYLRKFTCKDMKLIEVAQGCSVSFTCINTYTLITVNTQLGPMDKASPCLGDRVQRAT
jgi:hypothetical protein